MTVVQMIGPEVLAFSQMFYAVLFGAVAVLSLVIAAISLLGVRLNESETGHRDFSTVRTWLIFGVLSGISVVGVAVFDAPGSGFVQLVLLLAVVVLVFFVGSLQRRVQQLEQATGIDRKADEAAADPAGSEGDASAHRSGE